MLASDESVVQLTIGGAWLESFDVRVPFQERLDVAEWASVCSFRLLLRDTLGVCGLGSTRGRGRRGGRNRRGDWRRLIHWEAALKRLEGIERLGARHGFRVELGDERWHGEDPHWVVGVANAEVHRELAQFLLADHSDVVPLGNLCIADLLLHLFVEQVGLREESVQAQLAHHPLRVSVALLTDGHDHDLAWGQPEWPFSGVVFHQDGGHPLDRPEDRAVDDHWALEAALQPTLLPDDFAFLVLLVWDALEGTALLLAVLASLLVPLFPVL
mmetsp:Transcript_13954/g.38130  ORF Transcript_13954/g.38130 Transcript_13954/m.38130 type:complete len:271 (+) Transcript_13954:325-1137(+)